MMWFDRPDALNELQHRRDAGRVSSSQFLLLQKFILDGYVILPEKIPATLIDAINTDFDNARHNRTHVLLRKEGEYFHPSHRGVIDRRKRVIDFYVPSHAALEAILSHPVTDFLSALYQEAPLAFQSLLFQFGSEQAMHQDTAYVVTDHATSITASWIALMDIAPGSGELMYYKGSHRSIDVSFEDGKKVWARQVDSREKNQNYQERLVQACEQAGLQKEHFLPRKGEVLIWHSSLVHGGGVITDTALTRRSLVAHYCPFSGTPNYFNVPNGLSYKRPFANGFYASRHYDIRPESNNPYPIFTAGKNIAAEKGLVYGDKKTL